MEKKLLLLLLICAQISLAFEPWNKKQYIDCVDSSKQYILAADVSMVNTTVGLFEVMGQVPTLIIEYSAKTSEIKSLSQAVQTIVRTLEQNYHVVPQVISIASPGAVDVAEKTIQHPHLPWVLANSNDAKGIDAKAIQCATGISNILLINDFQAGAYGIQHAAITTKTLQAGQAQETGTKAVVGAGNG
nr:glucokinase [Candidatus Babeliales bacterium]